MLNKTFSRQNLNFTLFDVLETQKLTEYAYFSAHTAETIGFTLDIAEDIAVKILIPAYVDSDRKQPELIGGKVQVHQGIQAFVKAFSEAGLLAAPFENEHGGLQLPKTVALALDFILGSAHNSAIMYTDLTKGVANLIQTFGSAEQKATFLPKIFSGEWLGTMCLTETEAGSSLSDITTSATPQSNGTFKIKGQKIFISAGDHDVTENILHLVLARIDGAPKGTKGISLFIVPKNRVNTEGVLMSNDVSSISIYHKMGQKATPAMHLEFGANDDCTGYLIGEANKGLPHMFLMMNGARLGVGLAGIQISSAAYHTSLQYAKERLQGRRLHEKTALGEPIPIIEHPDVRRMLFLQKAIAEGGLSLVLQCAKYMDFVKAHPDDTSLKTRYNALLELLTPVAKTFGAEQGFLAVNQGLQVLGGYGYTEDFELEQMARDVRIMSLYEGTTGIQSQALLGRQVIGTQGASLKIWQEIIENDINEAEKNTTLSPYAEKLKAQMAHLQKVTNHLMTVTVSSDIEVALSDANLYMEAFGTLNVAWQWLKHGIAAEKGLSKNDISHDESIFYQSKIQTMQFYYHYELPKTQSLFARLMDTKALTIFNEETETLI